MIPKIIHYCWFGGKDLPENVQKCIESWRKFAPDYEIKRWDESNLDVNANTYTKEAYEHKKYAFVSDVARLSVVAKYGGFYLDTDVELIKPLDELRKYDAVMGIESGKTNVATGLGFGAIPNHPVIIENMNMYKNRSFIDPKSGKIDLTTCVTITKQALAQMLPSFEVTSEPVTLSMPKTSLKFTILPIEYLCPYNMATGKTHITDKTISIHHYDATWKSKKDKFLRLKIKIRQILGDHMYDKIKSLK